MAQDASSHWVTGVSEIGADDVYVRGYPLQALIGALPFSGLAYLAIRGKPPTPGEARMMDAVLGSILDYGLQKAGTIAARAVVSVNPAMTAGLSAAMLGAGEYAMSPEATGRFIASSYRRWQASGAAMDDYARTFVAELRADKQRVPGLGHPVFRFVDPRAQKLKTIAQREGVWGEINEWFDAVHRAFQAAAQKPDLVMNDIGMLAGILAQMGFTPPEMTGLALLSSFPGVIAHVSEELQSGVRLRTIPDANVTQAGVRRDLSADLAAAGWT